MREDGAAEGPKRPDGVNDKPPKAERRRRVSVKSPRESRRFPEHLLRAGHRAKCRGHAATYVASFPLGKSAAGHGVTAAPRSLPRTGLQTLPAALSPAYLRADGRLFREVESLSRRLPRVPLRFAACRLSSPRILVRAFRAFCTPCTVPLFLTSFVLPPPFPPPPGKAGRYVSSVKWSVP